MQLRDLLDPYYLVRKLSFSESPLLVKFFGLRAELANYGDPVHQAIFEDVEAWRKKWLRSGERTVDDHLRLASYALSAGRCRDSVLERQLGFRQLLVERVFFCGAFFLTVLQVAISSCIHLVRKNTLLKPSHGTVCFSANRTVRATVAKLFATGEVHHLKNYSYFVNLGAINFFLRTLWKAPRLLANPRLLSSFLRLLAQYCFVAEQFRPNTIIGFFDSTPSISLITAYLRERKIAHYNIMHGEIFFSCDHSSYVEVDRFYIWGEYYRSVLLQQRCTGEQFEILASPVLTELYYNCRAQNQPREKSLLVLHEPFIEQNQQVFANMIHLICAIDATWRVSVRPHPAYTGNLETFIGKIRTQLPPALAAIEITIESPHKVTPPETLARHRVVASCVSTMLLEGWLAGCKLVYFSGVMNDGFILERFQGSPNVSLSNANVRQDELREFVETPSILDDEEIRRVDRVVNIIPVRHT